jgi:septum formation protein
LSGVGRPRLVLASASPRRRELLARLGLEFEVRPAADDGPPQAGPPAEQVLGHARHKAAEVAAAAGADAWVLAADTLVFLGGRPLSKPADRTEAAAMLEALSGREHEVWTGAVLLAPDGRRHERADVARVRFAPLPAAELRAYLAGEEWRDKAGAYALQGWAGRHARVIAGDPETVVGLSGAAVLELLARAGALR